MSRYRVDQAHVTVTPYGSRLLVRWQSDAHFWDIRASFDAALSRHGERCWSKRHEAWSVSPQGRPRLERWLWLTFEPSCVEWLEEQPAGAYGRTYSSNSRYSGARQRPSSTTSSVDAAFAALHLLPTAPAWAAEAVYRAAIKIHHPDAGGDGQTMVRLNLAMERIREHHEEKEKAS